MFYLKWAIKNLARNRNRSLGVVMLLMSSSMIFFIGLAFLEGSQNQMTRVLRSYVGDIRVSAKNDDVDFHPILQAMEELPEYDAVDYIVKEYRIYGEIISKYGYARGAVVGISPRFFKEMGKDVEWESGSPIPGNHEGIIERSYARELGVTTGDMVTLSYVTPSGAINTGSYQIRGIFIGNKYEHNNKIYVPLSNAQELAMAEGKISRIKIFFKSPEDKTLQAFVNLFKNYSDQTHIKVWQWVPEGHVFYQVFQYSKLFMAITITIAIIVLLFVLFFSIQNSFHLIFNERANEISVLATYGMTFFKMYRMIFWESVLLLVTGVGLGYSVSRITSMVLTTVKLTAISDEMIVVLGGPRLLFDFIPADFTTVAAYILGVGLLSTFYALRKYLKSEVREMQLGI